MNAGDSTIRHGSTTEFGEERGLLHAGRLAAAIKSRWRRGNSPDLTDALTSHPELRRYRSVVLDLAYTEYQVRRQSGESLDAETFSRRFPSLERSLYLLIEVHGLLSQDPEIQNLQESLAWPEVGSRFLQFDLLAEIGRGAFGQVFLAREVALGGRVIVVKVAPCAGGEAEILGKLQHPNIVPVYSLQEDETTRLAAFCMPYLGRATLADVLDHVFAQETAPVRARAILDAIATVRDDAPPKDAPAGSSFLRRASYVNGVIHIAAQLADALTHSHGRGIYHRDLKPSNVLITPDGTPLLLDFNLSVEAGLPTWKIGGTLPYMAPEELAYLDDEEQGSRVRHYDPRSDLFSLGVILYQLLTGRLPFGPMPQGRSIKEAAAELHRRQAKGPQPIRQWNKHVDRRLARLVESCLAFEPDQRPETAQRLAVLLRRELSLTRRSRRWTGNHRGLVLSLGSVTFSAVLAVSLLVALRPSYDARQLQLGLAYCQRGEYNSAIDCLSDAIRADHNSAEALYARGLAYYRLGDFGMALHDYLAATRLHPTPLGLACKGYCFSQLGQHLSAIGIYKAALEAGFDAPALLYNNIGRGYLAVSQVKPAERNLREAVRLDDSLQAVHYNLMWLFVKRAAHGQPVPHTALVHAIKAVETGPCNADLYRTIATFYASAAEQDASLVPAAIDYVGKAIEHGCDPKEIDSHMSSFSLLQKEPAFRDALQRPVTARTPLKVTALLDPLQASASLP